MKNLNYYLLVILAGVLFAFSSCNKENENEVLKDNLITDDEVAAWFEEILAEVDELTLVNETKENEFLMEALTGTRTITSSFSGDTLIRSISYTGFVNPNSPGERNRDGIIVIKVVGRPQLPKFWREAKFVDFKVDGNRIEGIKTIEKTAENQFSISLKNGKVIFEDGRTYTKQFSRVRKQVAGTSTPFFIWDDEFTTEGVATGVNRAGKNYVHTIREPLLYRRNCRWIVKGVIEFAVEDNLATLNYGDGTCDRFATLTINGESTVITLGRRR